MASYTGSNSKAASSRGNRDTGHFLPLASSYSNSSVLRSNHWNMGGNHETAAVPQSGVATPLLYHSTSSPRLAPRRHDSHRSSIAAVGSNSPRPATPPAAGSHPHLYGRVRSLDSLTRTEGTHNPGNRSMSWAPQSSVAHMMNQPSQPLPMSPLSAMSATNDRHASPYRRARSPSVDASVAYHTAPGIAHGAAVGPHLMSPLALSAARMRTASTTTAGRSVGSEHDKESIRSGRSHPYSTSAPMNNNYYLASHGYAPLSNSTAAPSNELDLARAASIHRNNVGVGSSIAGDWQSVKHLHDDQDDEGANEDVALIAVNHIPISASILLFSLVGVVLRIAVSGGIAMLRSPLQIAARAAPIADAPWSPFLGSAVMWAALAQLYLPQLLGSFIMGWVVQGRDYLTRIYLPLYMGLATGLCGSVTSFSTVVSVSVGPLVSDATAWKVGIHYLSVTLLLLTAFSLSHTFFRIGLHLGSIMPGFGFPVAHPSFNFPIALGAPTFFARLSPRDGFTVTLALLLWFLAIGGTVASYILWGVTEPTSQALLAVSLGPLGALTRYMFGTMFRSPGGTLASNWVAVLICAGLRATVNATGASSVEGWAAFVEPIVLGYCGSLSTVSSFICEVDDMEPRRATGYILVSVLPSVVFMVLGLGLPLYLMG